MGDEIIWGAGYLLSQSFADAAHCWAGWPLLDANIRDLDMCKYICIIGAHGTAQDTSSVAGSNTASSANNQALLPGPGLLLRKSVLGLLLRKSVLEPPVMCCRVTIIVVATKVTGTIWGLGSGCSTQVLSVRGSAFGGSMQERGGGGGVERSVGVREEALPWRT